MFWSSTDVFGEDCFFFSQYWVTRTFGPFCFLPYQAGGRRIMPLEAVGVKSPAAPLDEAGLAAIEVTSFGLSCIFLARK